MIDMPRTRRGNLNLVLVVWKWKRRRERSDVKDKWEQYLPFGFSQCELSISQLNSHTLCKKSVTSSQDTKSLSKKPVWHTLTKNGKVLYSLFRAFYVMWGSSSSRRFISTQEIQLILQRLKYLSISVIGDSRQSAVIPWLYRNFFAKQQFYRSQVPPSSIVL